MVVYENIKALRHNRKWTQKDVAARLGICTPAFSKMETGITDISFSRLEQIANIYEIHVSELFVDNTGKIAYKRSDLDILEKKLIDREAEITSLQRKLIWLFEELANNNHANVIK